MNSKKVSLEDKFGQMIMLGLDTYEINDEIIEIIKKYKIGGVVLYRKNYTSIESMIRFINKLKNININNVPLFIAIDQENGRVNRFPKEIETMHSPLKQAKCHNEKVVDYINEISCYLMNSLGINMNFAPCIDILHDNKNKVIGNRSYGSSEDVIKYGLSYMKCLKNNNIISVLKHFPNHGLINKDSHIIRPNIKNKKLLNKDMIVYKEAIKNNCEVIMTDHVKINGYGNSPASCNKKIIDKYLIKDLNYNGLLITDDLRMGTMRFNLKSNIIKSIDAGNNIIMIKYKKGDYNGLYRDLFKMVKNYEIDPEKVYFNYKKIINLKNKYKVNNDEINPKLNIDLINKRIIKVNEIIDKEINK